MNTVRKSILYLLVLSLFLITSCTAYKKVGYLRETTSETIKDTSIHESRIFPNDLLTIVVNTSTPEAGAAFNLPLIPTSVIGNTAVNSSVGLQTYLVESDGTITMPIIGKLNVLGKTKRELETIIKEKIYPKYITEEPIIHVRFVNFKISVTGEVNKPGNFNINNERVTIFDALALAGDMTLYGRRNNVLVIRENITGDKEIARLDLQNKNIINSPFYYLQQNDVVYVEPNKNKGNASAISSVETLSISVTSTLISLTSLLITVFK